MLQPRSVRNRVWIRSHSELRRGIQRVKQLIEAVKAETSVMEARPGEESWLTYRSQRRGKRTARAGKSFAIRADRDTTSCGAKTERSADTELNCQISPDLPQPRIRLRKTRERKGEEDHYRAQSASISSLLMSPHKENWLFGGLKGGKKLHIARNYEIHRRSRIENEPVMDVKAAVLSHRGELSEVSKARLAVPRPLRVRNSQGSLPRLPSPKSPGLRFQRTVARTAASMQKEQVAGWE